MSSSSKPSVYLAGATGLTGGDTLQAILSSPSQFSSISTITRRPLSPTSPTSPSTPHTNLVFNFADPSTWSLASPSASTPGPTAGERVFVSALGTTRAAAGSVEKQREIDLELNYSLAKAAKEDGIETIILVSSSGASATSMAAYPKMKGELEERVKALGFQRTVILQPGLLIGAREESRTAEGIAQSLFKGLRWAGVPGMASMMVDTKVVGRAIANLALSKESGVHYYGNREIIDLAGAPPS